MKHTLRKYISNCGSALFMVVSTMAALILLVTAMYLSVMSSRTAQLTVFNQEQNYVSASSISDIVAAYIVDDANGSSALVTKMLALDSPDVSGGTSVIKTNGNGFASLTAGGVGSDDTVLGGYDVTITRLADEKDSGKTLRVYDIAVTVSNNGTYETAHMQISIPEAEPSTMPAIEQFFTATGYLPNDVLVDSMVKTDAPMIFDAEYVEFDQTVYSMGGSEPVFRTDMICAGTFQHGSAGRFEGSSSEPMDWVIGNNLIINRSNYGYPLGRGGVDGNMYVGGNLYSGTNIAVGATGQETNLYIQGDAFLDTFKVVGEAYFGGSVEIGGTNSSFDQAVYIKNNLEYDHLVTNDLAVICGNMSSEGSSSSAWGSNFNGKTYVGKDLILKSSSSSIKTTNFHDDVVVVGNVVLSGLCEFKKNLYVLGNLTVNVVDGTQAKFDGNVYVKGTVTTNGGATVTTQALTDDTAKDYIKANFNVDTGEKDADGNAVVKSLIDGVDSTSGVGTTKLSDAVTYMNKRIGGSVYPKWVVTSAKFAETPVDITFCDGDIDGDYSDVNASTYFYYINEDCVIGDITVEAGGNKRFTIVIYTGSEETDVRKIRVSANCADGKTFSWMPDRTDCPVNIVTVGKGSLVIDVPEGVTYQATRDEYIGHAGWLMMSGVTFDSTTGALSSHSANNFVDPITNHGIIHSSCTTCDYEEAEVNGQECYTCKKHGGTFTAVAYEEYKAGARTCLCEGRVDYDKVDAYWTNNSTKKAEALKFLTLKKNTLSDENLITDSLDEDDILHPNVDLFIVSCEESADIQFGADKNGTVDFAADSTITLSSGGLNNNVFFAYIYAPYMTFVQLGDGGAGIKGAGGLVVSDYVISAPYSFFYIQPTRSIENIAGADEILSPQGGRDWRIYGT